MPEDFSHIEAQHKEIRKCWQVFADKHDIKDEGIEFLAFIHGWTSRDLYSETPEQWQRKT